MPKPPEGEFSTIPSSTAIGEAACGACGASLGSLSPGRPQVVGPNGRAPGYPGVVALNLSGLG